MKNTTTIFLLFLLFQSGLFAQVAIEDENYTDYFENTAAPIVNIKVLNISEEERKDITVTCSVVTPLERDEMSKTRTGNLDDEGIFTLKLDYPFPNQQIWLRVGQLFYNAIYVNTDLTIVLDADSLKSKNINSRRNGVHFKGLDKELNNVLSSHYSYKRNITRGVTKKITYLKRNNKIEYAEFIVKFDSLYSILHSIDDEYIRKYPSRYSLLIKNERYSKYYWGLCVRHLNSPMDTALFEEVRNHKVYLTSNSGAGFQRSFYIYLEVGNNSLIDYSQFYDDEKQDLNKRNTLDSLLFYRERAIVNYPTLKTSNNIMSTDYIKFHNFRHKLNRILGD